MQIPSLIREITARQFDSIRCDLQGNIDSAKRIISRRIVNLKGNIDSISKLIKNKQAKIRKTTKDKNLNFMVRPWVRFPLLQENRGLTRIKARIPDVNRW